MFWLDMAINVVFLTDIILIFFLAYYDSEFNLIDEPRVSSPLINNYAVDQTPLFEDLVHHGFAINYTP